MDNWKRLEEKFKKRGFSVIHYEDKDIISETGTAIRVREALKGAGIPEYTQEQKEEIVNKWNNGVQEYLNLTQGY